MKIYLFQANRKKKEDNLDIQSEQKKIGGKCK